MEGVAERSFGRSKSEQLQGRDLRGSVLVGEVVSLMTCLFDGVLSNLSISHYLSPSFSSNREVEEDLDPEVKYQKERDRRYANNARER